TARATFPSAGSPTMLLAASSLGAQAAGMQLISPIIATALTLLMSQLAEATELKVISGGAFKQVLTALAAQYEKESGNTLAITYRTVGQHLTLIRDGQEEFDVAVLTPEAIDGLAKEGKV